MSPEIEVIIRNEQPVDVDLGALRGAIVETLNTMRLDAVEPCEVSVVLADEAAIQRLNAAHRGKDRPTDVLAFPQSDDTDAGEAVELLGDLVICPAVTAVNAGDLNREPSDELLEVAVHGVLHLLGYDDSDDEGRRGMFELQARVLSRLPGGGPIPHDA